MIKKQKIKLIITDFDGVWTDGKVYCDEEGKEMVVCSRKDTLRIPEIKSLGIKIVVISKEKNSVVAKRCEKMEVDYYFGIDKKLDLLKSILEKEKVKTEEVMYIGDDINDLECLKFVGLPATVADGHSECKEAARFVASRKGGDHAMREVFDLILDNYFLE